MTTSEALRILELQRPVTAAQVKAAFREMARRHHPDTAGASNREGDEFIRIKKAYDLLQSLSEEEINKRYFDPRDFSQPHKPGANRGNITLPDTQFYRELENVFYMFNKLRNNKQIIRFLLFISRLVRFNRENPIGKFIRVIFILFTIIVLFPVLLAAGLAIAPLYLAYARVADHYYEQSRKQNLLFRLLILMVTDIVFVLLCLLAIYHPNMYLILFILAFFLPILILHLSLYMDYKKYKAVR